MKWVLLAVVASSLIVLSAQQIMCPESGITRHADPSSCTQFHLCYNGVFLEMSCANGLFFSESEQVCLPPREANCTAPQTVCPTELEPGQFVFLSNGRTCDTFFWCANMGDSVGINVGTCAPGLLFNRATLMCDPNAQCQVTRWSCSVNRDTVYPDDEDCSRFFHCYRGVQYGGHCPDGLLFDAIVGRCVHPRFATCGQFTTIPATSSTAFHSQPSFTTPTTVTTQQTTIAMSKK